MNMVLICSEVLEERPNLFVVTRLGLLRLNANTLEVVESLDFRGTSH